MRVLSVKYGVRGYSIEIEVDIEGYLTCVILKSGSITVLWEFGSCSIKLDMPAIYVWFLGQW